MDGITDGQIRLKTLPSGNFVGGRLSALYKKDINKRQHKREMT